MRLFVAIELTDPAREQIAAEQNRVVAALRGANRVPPRLVQPDHMHLTLSFIGEVNEDRAPAIVEVISDPIEMAPFEVAFGGVGAFPPRGAPRALWLGLVEGASATIALQRIISDRLQTVGIAPERREFHPHLTLGRWKESRPSDHPRHEHARPATVARLGVDGVTLIHSRLSSAAPTYTALVRAPLGGRPALH